MSAKKFPRILLWELRHLRRSGLAWLVCGGLLIASLLAIWTGGKNLAAHRAAVAALPPHYAAQQAGIAKQFTPEGEAGYVAYYNFFPTHRPLPPLAALATGVSDVVPAIVWVRLLGLEAQLYEADIGNPALQALGGFDLAFVLCALAPLGLLVLAHDALTRDRDQGRFSLVAAQAGRLGPLLAARIGVRALALAATATLAFAVACLWLRIPPDVAVARWLGAVLAHLACWAALAALIAAATRSAAASLAAALTTWVAAVVLLPALLNLAVATAFPVPEGLALTVRQRQEIHGGWDQPKADTFAKFFVTHPEWRDTPPVTARFAWKWYYAMQQVGDESVSADSTAFRENLRARQRLMTRLAWIAPPAYAQLLLAARADTDLDAHLAYLDRVRAFHAELRRYFYPLVFTARSITPADYAVFPKFSASTPPPPSGPSVLPLLLLTAGLLALTHRVLRRSAL